MDQGALLLLLLRNIRGDVAGKLGRPTGGFQQRASLSRGDVLHSGRCVCHSDEGELLGDAAAFDESPAILWTHPAVTPPGPHVQKGAFVPTVHWDILDSRTGAAAKWVQSSPLLCSPLYSSAVQSSVIQSRTVQTSSVQLSPAQSSPCEVPNCAGDPKPNKVAMVEEATDGAQLCSVDFEIFGHVQGVCFRMYSEAEGQRLGVSGWVKNTRRGSVMGQVQGPPHLVNEMKVWLSKEGSPGSRITRAVFSNERNIPKLEITGFTTRY
ncbi:acylphosphatase-2-like [Arapaima gigas]